MKAPRDQHRTARALLVAMIASLCGHLAGFGLATRLPPPPPRPLNEAVEFEVVEIEPPPEEPEPEPEPQPEPEPPPPPPPPSRPPPRAEPPPPPTAEKPPPPPPNAPPPPEETPPAPIRVGVSLSSTTEAGSFSVGTGNTLYGETASQAADPAEVRPYAAREVKQAPFVPASRLSRLPRQRNLRKPEYPAWARREGIEGQVQLRVRIDEKGKVVSVRVLRGLGRDFDERAVAALKVADFDPAIHDGEPVSTEITFTITYQLD